MQVLFPKKDSFLLTIPYSDAKLTDCICTCVKDFFNTFPMFPINSIVRIETVKGIMGSSRYARSPRGSGCRNMATVLTYLVSSL